jgi:hypothetical protein
MRCTATMLAVDLDFREKVGQRLYGRSVPLTRQDIPEDPRRKTEIERHFINTHMNRHCASSAVSGGIHDP